MKTAWKLFWYIAACAFAGGFGYMLFMATQQQAENDRRYAEYQQKVQSACEARGGVAIWDAGLHHVTQCAIPPTAVTPEAK